MTSGEAEREEAMSETLVKEYTEEEREDIVGRLEDVGEGCSVGLILYPSLLG
jgi:hypothetical protein